jgi:hypothetical protein
MSSDTDLKLPKWSLGILNDKETDEVPGKFENTWIRTLQSF